MHNPAAGYLSQNRLNGESLVSSISRLDYCGNIIVPNVVTLIEFHSADEDPTIILPTDNEIKFFGKKSREHSPSYSGESLRIVYRSLKNLVRDIYPSGASFLSRIHQDATSDERFELELFKDELNKSEKDGEQKIGQNLYL